MTGKVLARHSFALEYATQHVRTAAETAQQWMLSGKCAHAVAASSFYSIEKEIARFVMHLRPEVQTYFASEEHSSVRRVIPV